MQYSYLFNFFSGFDRWANAIFGGDPRETISSRMGKALHAHCRLCRWTAGVVCKLLNMIDDRHCQKSVDATVGDRSVLGKD